MQITEAPQEALENPETGNAVQVAQKVSEVDRKVHQGAELEGAAGPDFPDKEEARLLAEQAADPDLRMDRIKVIQAAIADGAYSISANDVAAKLVDDLLKK